MISLPAAPGTTSVFAALDVATVAVIGKRRLAFTSCSLSGVWAAVEAGLGITVRTTVAMPGGLAMVDASSEHLPTLPTVPLALHRAEANPAPALVRLVDVLLAAIGDETASGASDLINPSSSAKDDFESSRFSTPSLLPT